MTIVCFLFSMPGGRTLSAQHNYTLSEVRSGKGFLAPAGECGDARGVVADDAVDAEIEQALDLGRVVDGPGVELQTERVRGADARRSNQLDAGEGRRGLQRVTRRAVARQRAVRQPNGERGHLAVAESRRDGRIRPERRANIAHDIVALGGEEDVVLLAGAADGVEDTVDDRRLILLDFGDRLDVAQAVKNLRKRRNGYATAAKGIIAVVVAEAKAGVEPLELGERHALHCAAAVGRAIHRLVVDEEDLPLSRPVSVPP